MRMLTGTRSRTALILRVLCVHRSGSFVLASLMLLTTLSGAGCGYALAGRGSFLPDYIKTIGIPGFTNSSTVFNLETLLTQKVRGEFIGRGKYKILPQAAGVDAVLTGIVSSVTITPTSFSAVQLASRYAITMVASLELRDLQENKVLWANPSLVFRQDYDAQSSRNALDPAAFFSQDVNALERMSSEFARSIVSAILETF